MSAIYVSMHTTRRETVFEACTFDGDQSVLMCTGFILDKITLLPKEGENPLSDVSNLGFVHLTQKSVQNTLR